MDSNFRVFTSCEQFICHLPTSTTTVLKQNPNMHPIIIKEILSAAHAEYKLFLAAALECDKENLLITPKDNEESFFPTKDREDSFTLGAYAENELVGVVSFSRDGDTREKLRHKGHIATMYVSIKFRGHGIAKSLLEEVVKRVKTIAGIEQINLIVLSTNTVAQKVYTTFGFVKYGTELHSIKWEGEYFSEDLMVLRFQ